MRLVTASELRSFRSCAREHRYRYVELRRPRASDPKLRFGSLFHRALEAWWLAVDAGPEAQLAAALDALGPAEQSELFDRVRTEELLLGYTARWSDEALDVLAVEAEFRCPVTNPATGAASRTFELGGKIDAIARERATGRVLIVEHKTSAEDISTGSAYWQRLRLDAQVSTYFVGARALGHDVQACLYDVIHRPTLRPYAATPVEARKFTRDGRLYANQREQDETSEEFRARLREDIAANPSRYFARGEVVRLEEDERDAAHDVWQLTRQLREAELAGRAPRNPDACIRYGRSCDYWPVCSRECALSDEARYRDAAAAHEELSNGGNGNGQPAE